MTDLFMLLTFVRKETENGTRLAQERIFRHTEEIPARQHFKDLSETKDGVALIYQLYDVNTDDIGSIKLIEKYGEIPKELLALGD